MTRVTPCLLHLALSALTSHSLSRPLPLTLRSIQTGCRNPQPNPPSPPRRRRLPRLRACRQQRWRLTPPRGRTISRDSSRGSSRGRRHRCPGLASGRPPNACAAGRPRGHPESRPAGEKEFHLKMLDPNSNSNSNCAGRPSHVFHYC